jgi:hypothetical protein
MYLSVYVLTRDKSRQMMLWHRDDKHMCICIHVYMYICILFLCARIVNMHVSTYVCDIHIHLLRAWIDILWKAVFLVQRAHMYVKTDIKAYESKF